MIADRLKALRRELGLSQTEFGEKLGLTRNAVNNAENGRAEVSEILIRSVVREFGISETWLRTGEGDMYVPRTRLEEITSRIGAMAGEEPNPFREKLILALLRIPPDRWPLIEQAAREILDDTNEKGREP